MGALGRAAQLREGVVGLVYTNSLSDCSVCPAGPAWSQVLTRQGCSNEPNSLTFAISDFPEHRKKFATFVSGPAAPRGEGPRGLTRPRSSSLICNLPDIGTSPPRAGSCAGPRPSRHAARRRRPISLSPKLCAARRRKGSSQESCRQISAIGSTRSSRLPFAPCRPRRDRHFGLPDARARLREAWVSRILLSSTFFVGVPHVTFARQGCCAQGRDTA